jgi:hypothetical protein
MGGYIMASTINADTTNGVVVTSDTSGEIKLQSAGADVATIDSSGLSMGSGMKLTSTGHILQVLQATKTDTFSTNSQTFVDITDLEVTITPLSTSSKILLLYNVSCGVTSGHSVIKAVRTIGGTTTDVLVGDADGSNRVRANNKIYNTSTYNTTYTTYSMVGQILDSPNTTSAVTYKIQGASPYSASYTLVVNRTGTTSDISWDARTSSQITVMEVAA